MKFVSNPEYKIIWKDLTAINRLGQSQYLICLKFKHRLSIQDISGLTH
jgi:hypothetical protein